MAQNATIASHVRIGSQENGGPFLGPLDQFGSSVAAIGDLNGDGVPDLMVGAPGSEFLSGAYILFLNSDGSVAQHKLIRGEFLNNTIGGYDINGPPISYGSRLGFAVAALGDVDLDGITDLAIVSGRPPNTHTHYIALSTSITVSIVFLELNQLWIRLGARVYNVIARIAY